MDRAISVLSDNIGAMNGMPVVVLCRSQRAAGLAKNSLIELSRNKGLLGLEVLSLGTFITDRARKLGLESKVIGALGRERMIRDILSTKQFLGAGHC